MTTQVSTRRRKRIASAHVHKLHSYKALVEEQGLSGLTLSAYVFTERAYVVGQVESQEQKRRY